MDHRIDVRLFKIAVLQRDGDFAIDKKHGMQAELRSK